MEKQFNTPIAFIIFNRPDTTQLVFNEIRKIKPKQLFVISDGPRDEKEIKIVEKTRKIIDLVDWDCKVEKNYSDTNIGLKKRISSGLKWFFDNVEQGIILEDDCLPDPSFFRYCEELLEKYKSNPKIMSITGDNFQDGIKRDTGDYYFSNYFHCWGWATWKRSWDKFDIEMKSYPKFKEENKIKNIFKQKKIREYWLKTFDNVYNGKINTWAKIFTYTSFLNEGLCCTPNVNLVSNIGFDQRGTHTKNKKGGGSNIPRKEMIFPLKHPSVVKPNREADDYTSKNVFKIKNKKNKMQKIKNILKKIGLFNIIKSIYLKFTNNPKKNIKKIYKEKETTWKNSYKFIPEVINKNNFKIGAEIGIAFGGHIENILKNTNIEKIYGIDPHQHIDGYIDSMNLPQEEFDILNTFVLKRLKKFGNRFVNIRNFSDKAVEDIKESLDFIYIDGDHSYKGVKKDLDIWFPKIKKGGIMSGHDYGHSSHQGVKKAVDEFFINKNLKIDILGNEIWCVKK